MLRQQFQRAIAFARKRAFYWVQYLTGWGINKRLEVQLRNKADKFVAKEEVEAVDQVATKLVENFDFSDSGKFSLIRDDIYKRFIVLEDGTESDDFGRKGRWVPRGCRIFLDHSEDVYIKVFDEYFCTKGEGRFLPDALKKGVYNFLCPALAYLIVDSHEHLRGYAIRSGRVLSPYEFERYVEVALKDAVCEVTRRSGLYFNDLTYHNAILRGDEISLIDLESVLPLSWYGQDMAFSMRMIQQIDIGYPIQSDFHSPSWYAKYIEELIAVPSDAGDENLH